MLYRKLFIVSIFSLFFLVQAKESVEPCFKLEKDFNFIPHTNSAARSMTISFLENLHQCNPSIQDKLYYLKAILNILNNSDSSNKIEMMAFASQNILDSLETPSLNTARQVLSELQNSRISEVQDKLQKHDLFFAPAYIGDNIPSKNRMVKRKTQILNKDFEVTSIVYYITADFVLCQNTENIVSIILPLITWINQEITSILLANHFSHPHLFYSSALAGLNAGPFKVGLNFPNHLSSEQLDFLIDQLPSSAYAQVLKQHFLEPIYELMSIRDMYNQKFKEHCTDEVQKWENVKFLEDHYKLISNIPPEKGRKFFKQLSHELALPNAIILNLTAGPNHQNFYRFSIQLPQ